MQSVPAYAFTIPDAARYSGLGRSRLYELFQTGELLPRKQAGRTLVLRKDIEAYLDRLPIWKPSNQR